MDEAKFTNEETDKIGFAALKAAHKVIAKKNATFENDEDGKKTMKCFIGALKAAAGVVEKARKTKQLANPKSYVCGPYIDVGSIVITATVAHGFDGNINDWHYNPQCLGNIDAIVKLLQATELISTASAIMSDWPVWEIASTFDVQDIIKFKYV